MNITEKDIGRKVKRRDGLVGEIQTVMIGMTTDYPITVTWENGRINFHDINGFYDNESLPCNRDIVGFVDEPTEEPVKELVRDSLMVITEADIGRGVKSKDGSIGTIKEIRGDDAYGFYPVVVDWGHERHLHTTTGKLWTDKTSDKDIIGFYGEAPTRNSEDEPVKASKDNIKDKKPPYRYLGKPMLDSIADAHLAGEVKYGAWNYLKGHTVMQLLEAMERHIAYIKAGEDYDKDCSGRIGRLVHHLGCVGANVNMYLQQLELGTLTDDRPWKEYKRAND